VRRQGAQVTENVTPATTVLVVGERQTFARDVKVARAQELGIRTMTQAEFESLRTQR
jgi:NAD-dependent DNA ligase